MVFSCLIRNYRINNTLQQGTKHQNSILLLPNQNTILLCLCKNKINMLAYHLEYRKHLQGIKFQNTYIPTILFSAISIKKCLHTGTFLVRIRCLCLLILYHHITCTPISMLQDHTKMDKKLKKPLLIDRGNICHSLTAFVSVRVNSASPHAICCPI